MHSRCGLCSPAPTRRTFLTAFGLGAICASTKFACAAAGSPPDLTRELSRRPRIASAISWFAPAAANQLVYAQWPTAWKHELKQFHDLLWAGQPLPLTDPPPNQSDPSVNETLLSTEDARHLFLALVAQSLVVEIGQRVPWSIGQDNDASFAALFSPAEMFVFDRRSGLYRVNWAGIAAPPDVAYHFLRTQALIGPTRRATIERLLQWCTARLVHFTGDTSNANLERQWQYYGEPPMSRIISGTVAAGRNDPPHHITAGCWGTAAFLAAMLRVVNVPVAREVVYQDPGSRKKAHATPHFLSEDLYLSHADDPYNLLVRLRPSRTASQILIGRDRFDQWFRSGGMADNVGRQPFELALADPPIGLLKDYVDDIAKGTAKTGQIWQNYSRYYSATELEKTGLWSRLEQRTAALGGPDAVKKEYRAAFDALQKSLSEP